MSYLTKAGVFVWLLLFLRVYNHIVLAQYNNNFPTIAQRLKSSCDTASRIGTLAVERRLTRIVIQ